MGLLMPRALLGLDQSTTTHHAITLVEDGELPGHHCLYWLIKAEPYAFAFPANGGSMQSTAIAHSAIYLGR